MSIVWKLILAFWAVIASFAAGALLGFYSPQAGTQWIVWIAAAAVAMAGAGMSLQASQTLAMYKRWFNYFQQAGLVRDVQEPIPVNVQRVKPEVQVIPPKVDKELASWRQASSVTAPNTPMVER